MDDSLIEVLVLVGRPASGKSEIIDYLQRLDPAERRRRFGLGDLEILDDFPLLWAWFEEDAILDRMGRPRLHTDAEGDFAGSHLWDVLIRRLSLGYDKLLAADPGLHAHASVIVEFSRGSEHGGYRRALAALSPAVAARASVLYVRVSFEESLRKNRKRFNPDRPHSILEHALPDDKLRRLYGRDDWDELERDADGRLVVGDRRLAAAAFENEDDVTTPRGAALGERLEACLRRLRALGGGSGAARGSGGSG
jgi:hypothetical protein